MNRSPRSLLLLALAAAGCDPAGGMALDARTPDAAPPAPDAAPFDAAPDAAPRHDGAPPDAAPTPDAAPAPDAAPEPDPPPGWLLVWHDEFDAPGGTPPDPGRWVHDVGGDGWGNQQLEFDTDRIENVAHDGEGHLAITARREAYQGRQYTSGRITTQGRAAHAYGRFEARIRLPTGPGIWPAFWLLGDDIGEVGWPACGEIDVMEHRGQAPYESTGALHGPGYSAGDALSATRLAFDPLHEDFHLFAVEWDPDLIVWMVDGEVFHRVRPGDLPAGSRWAFDHPFFVILNVAVGGTFVGPPDDATVFPQTMLVDHVRVYTRDPAVPRPDPGPRITLPMTVDRHYAPTGYMGDGAADGLTPVDCPRRGTDDPAGDCHGFRWTPGAAGWAGVYWQNPPDNWGALPGEALPGGATGISFLAWGEAGGEPIRFIAGYAESDGFEVATDVRLSPVPTRYTLDLEGVDYDEVRAAFGWVTGEGAAGPLTFYVDDITWR